MSSDVRKLNIWEVSGTELGFIAPVSESDIFSAASKHLFTYCPAEIGPLVFIKITSGSRYISMIPIISRSEASEIFYIYQSNHRWLHMVDTINKYKEVRMFNPKEKWLFLRRTKKPSDVCLAWV